MWVYSSSGVLMTYCCIDGLFAGTNVMNIEEVAIKLECMKEKHPQLHIEATFYKMMQSGGGSLMAISKHTHTHTHISLLPSPTLKAPQCVMDPPMPCACPQTATTDVNSPPYTALQPITHCTNYWSQADMPTCSVTRHTHAPDNNTPTNSC